jgi:hypothetical protein
MIRTTWLLAAAMAATLGLSTQAKAQQNWSGFYAGVLGEASFFSEDGSLWGVAGVAKVLGYNWDNGDLIYGFEKMLIVTPIEPLDGGFWKFSWQGMGRIGMAVTDNTMIYGAGGLGVSTVPSESFAVGYGAVAAGVEVAMNSNWRWRTHAQVSFPFDPGPTDGMPVVSFATGAIHGFN